VRRFGAGSARIGIGAKGAVDQGRQVNARE